MVQDLFKGSRGEGFLQGGVGGSGGGVGGGGWGGGGGGRRRGGVVKALQFTFEPRMKFP